MNTNRINNKSPNYELDDLLLDDTKPNKQESYAWSSAWEAAESHYNKNDNTPPNYTEAMKLYLEAAKLGCLMAYEKLGGMYKNEEGVLKNDQISLDYYKEGVKKGNYFCYAGMADIFIERCNTENFHKCFKLLFKNRKEHINIELEEQNSRKFYLYCFLYVNSCFENGILPLKETIQEMTEYKYEISNHLIMVIKFNRETLEMTAGIFNHLDNFTIETNSRIKLYQQSLDWVNEYL